jgi:transcription initiation factor TFIIB
MASTNVRHGTSERSSEAETTEERTERQTSERTVCPECDGELATDEKHGESVCQDCGLVVEEDAIDPGPEWRAFDAEKRDEKSRVGAPTTKMMHDEGLSTTIDWQNRDAYGNALSSRKRKRMQRLRTWDERFRTRNHKERNLKQALGEIDRMASALDLPESVRETASVIYRRALEEDLLPGRSIEGISTASLYAAIRQSGTPRGLEETISVSRVDEQEVKRAYRYIVRELSLEVQPADPESYLPRFAAELGLSSETEHRAKGMLGTAKEQAVHSGKSPIGLAAAALYAAGQLTGESPTQSEVSDVAGVSEVTIRNRYQELLEAEGDTGATA